MSRRRLHKPSRPQRMNPNLNPCHATQIGITPKEPLHHFTCPHCAGSIEVPASWINCKIFRHGIYKQNGQPMNPHAPKVVCDELFASGKIWGCGKPFKFDGKRVEIIGYI